jgi:flagellar protein FliO/FliZ
MFGKQEMKNLSDNRIFREHIQIKPSFLVPYLLPILFIFLATPSAFPQTAVQNQIADEETLILPDEAPAQTPSPASTSTFFVILRLVLVLALASAAIYGLVFLLKKFSRIREQKDPFLKILAGVSLGANRFIHVVSVGEKAWLVGSTDGGVSLISEIDDKETVDAMLLEDSRRNVETAKISGFATLMRRANTPPTSGGEPPKAENVRKTRERLRGL